MYVKILILQYIDYSWYTGLLKLKFIWVIPCEIYPRKFFFEKNMVRRVLCLKIINAYFLFQRDVWKFRKMSFKNFEIEKNDVFLIGYSNKSFGYGILLLYWKCASSPPPQLSRVVLIYIKINLSLCIKYNNIFNSVTNKNKYVPGWKFKKVRVLKVN